MHCWQCRVKNCCLVDRTCKIKEANSEVAILKILMILHSSILVTTRFASLQQVGLLLDHCKTNLYLQQVWCLQFRELRDSKVAKRVETCFCRPPSEFAISFRAGRATVARSIRVDGVRLIPVLLTSHNTHNLSHEIHKI